MTKTPNTSNWSRLVKTWRNYDIALHHNITIYQHLCSLQIRSDNSIWICQRSCFHCMQTGYFILFNLHTIKIQSITEILPKREGLNVISQPSNIGSGRACRTSQISPAPGQTQPQHQGTQSSRPMSASWGISKWVRTVWSSGGPCTSLWGSKLSRARIRKLPTGPQSHWRMGRSLLKWLSVSHKQFSKWAGSSWCCRPHITASYQCIQLLGRRYWANGCWPISRWTGKRAGRIPVPI